MQGQNTDEYVVDPETGCWVWQKGTRNGYGRVRRGQRLWTAHIWYWERAHGCVPAGMQLDHLCHTADKTCPGGNDCPHRRCVNPAHLEPVRHRENAQRGRLAKLTRAQVAEIRAQPHVSRNGLAEHYGVSSINIAKIRAGATWKDVPAAEGLQGAGIRLRYTHRPKEGR